MSFTPLLHSLSPFRLSLHSFLLLTFFATILVTNYSALVQIGPSRAFTSLSQALSSISNGDTIEFDPGVYTDFVTLTQDNLILRGLGSGEEFAHFNMRGVTITNGKATFVIQGDDVTVENLEFSGATVGDNNGAGIRWEGGGILTVVGCYFHGNQMQILTGVCLKGDQCEVQLENSVFEDTEARGGILGHNIYIGNIAKFSMIGCRSSNAEDGHQVKSRAQENWIAYNAILDMDGDSSLQVDLPNGGESYVIGNVIQQSYNAPNWGSISSGEEGATNDVQRLFVAYNTIVNDKASGNMLAVNFVGATEVVVANNLMADVSDVTGDPGSPVLTTLGNVVCHGGDCSERTFFVDRAGMDYHLQNGSFAISAASDLSSSYPLLIPEYQVNNKGDPINSLELIDRPNADDCGALAFGVGGGGIGDEPNSWVTTAIILGVSLPIVFLSLLLVVAAVLIVGFLKCKKGAES